MTSGAIARRPKGKRATRVAFALGATFVLLLSACIAARLDPSPLFAYAHVGRWVTLRSDVPLPTEAEALVRRVESTIARSPLFDRTKRYDVHLCASAWRFGLLSGGNRDATGVAFGPIARGVILRAADVRRNRIRQASGSEAPNERTLDFYVAHEVAHTMTNDRLGLRARALPAWVREGYADFVARGEGFDYVDARAALSGARRTRTPPQSGRYLRYALLVAHLLDREGWSVEDFLLAPPSRDAVEARVRAGTTQAHARGD